MNIIILSRSAELYSTQSLVNAARRRNHYVRVFDHMHCDLVIEKNGPCIYYHGQKIKNIQAIIPRIGSSATSFGASVIRQFELMKVFTTLKADPLLKARDKVSCMQILAAEAGGADVRVFVVNNEVVGVMKRQAAEGEFRSNLHRGATSEVIELTESEKQVARKAARVMGLKVAGVDMLQTSKGPLVLEVNASPGLEGIETTTGNDIAGKIIQYVEKNYNYL